MSYLDDIAADSGSSSKNEQGQKKLVFPCPNVILTLAMRLENRMDKARERVQIAKLFEISRKLAVVRKEWRML